MRETFRNYNGTIICGCPEYDINEIVSDLYKKSSQIKASINALIYVPHIPISELGEFSFIHRSNGYEYSILEALQYWFDILNSEIKPNKIKLIGINGGKLSSLEYRIAIAFGAHVGILTDEEEASNDMRDVKWDDIISDKQNQKFYRLYKKVVSSPEKVRKFLESKLIKEVDNENLGVLLIENIVNQTCIYAKEFSIIEIDSDRLVGLAAAIQFYSREIKMGRVCRIETVKGQLTLTNFKKKPFRVIFFLFDDPSDSLINKIARFTEKLEKKLGCELVQYGRKSQPYPGGPEMDKLLTEIFGSEIL